MWISHLILPGTNSSPRGDGNISLFIHASFARESIHPREGTETLQHRQQRSQGREPIHPREGTETASHFALCHSICRTNSSPRGDGNSVRMRLMSSHTWNQFIPARGRNPHNGISASVISRYNENFPFQNASFWDKQQLAVGRDDPGAPVQELPSAYTPTARDCHGRKRPRNDKHSSLPMSLS